MKTFIFFLILRLFSLVTIFAITLGMIPQKTEINLFNFFNKYHKNFWENNNYDLFSTIYSGFNKKSSALKDKNTHDLLRFFEKLILVVVFIEFVLFVFCHCLSYKSNVDRKDKANLKNSKEEIPSYSTTTFLISSKILAIENFFLLAIILFNCFSQLNPANSITIVLSIYTIQFFVFSMFIIEINF